MTDGEREPARLDVYLQLYFTLLYLGMGRTTKADEFSEKLCCKFFISGTKPSKIDSTIYGCIYASRYEGQIERERDHSEGQVWGSKAV